MKKETFEEFKKRMGIIALHNDDVDINLSCLIFFSSIYCYEQKLNWRRQIIKIKKLLIANRK